MILVIAAKNGYILDVKCIHVNVNGPKCFRYCRYVIEFLHFVCGTHVVGSEMKWFTFYEHFVYKKNFFSLHPYLYLLVSWA